MKLNKNNPSGDSWPAGLPAMAFHSNLPNLGPHNPLVMPMRSALFILFYMISMSSGLLAQEYENVYLDTMEISVHDMNTRYQPSRKRIVDIEHMRLEVKPNFEKRTMYGKAFISLRPYNSPINEVQFDAKGMDIRQVFVIHPDGFIPVEYDYDDLVLTIHLHRTYEPREQLTIFMEYVAQPYKLEEKGIHLSAGHGMYFIDPLDKNPYKPTQLWTQGETNANSVWFPTVDAPNEQFTQEIFITTDVRNTTLSNGLLTGTVINPDGTKTDHWEQSKPHGPHLVMMAVGKFHVSLDDWGPIAVTYYTVPEYSADVRKVFGQTPYMMSYFSKLFQVDFPWEKYAQMVVYDYISGAMENTTAVIIYAGYYADRYDLLDWNYDDIIAHELVHHWFGDLVSCESWAHLALNESFAQYGEYLWSDHQYGREQADYQMHEALFTYLNEFLYKSEPVVNFYYDDAEELFDSHRYEKGSCILHMLRDYLGDRYFFDGLTHYLRANKYHSAEIGDLRLSLEKISGEDLYWFFDQWFMKPGHPEVRISHSYDSTLGEVQVSIEQIQDITRYTTYQFPLAIDVYTRDGVKRHTVWVDERKEIFKFPASSAPKLVNVDAKKIMLWEKEEEKTRDELLYQYENAPLYADRIEAVNDLAFRQTDKKVRTAMLQALKDPFWNVRRHVLNNIDLIQFHASEGSIEAIQRLALTDENSRVRNAALDVLEQYDVTYALPVCDSLMHRDSSRLVLSTALAILYQHDPQTWYPAAERLEAEHNQTLKNTIASIYAQNGDAGKLDFFKRAIWTTRSYHATPLLESFVDFLQKMDLQTITEGAAYLSSLIEFEESEGIRQLAKNALYDLQDHFSHIREEGAEEKAGVLRSVIDDL